MKSMRGISARGAPFLRFSYLFSHLFSRSRLGDLETNSSSSHRPSTSPDSSDNAERNAGISIVAHLHLRATTRASSRSPLIPELINAPPPPPASGK